MQCGCTSCECAKRPVVRTRLGPLERMFLEACSLKQAPCSRDPLPRRGPQPQAWGWPIVRKRTPVRTCLCAARLEERREILRRGGCVRQRDARQADRWRLHCAAAGKRLVRRAGRLHMQHQDMCRSYSTETRILYWNVHCRWRAPCPTGRPPAHQGPDVVRTTCVGKTHRFDCPFVQSLANDVPGRQAACRQQAVSCRCAHRAAHCKLPPCC